MYSLFFFSKSHDKHNPGTYFMFFFSKKEMKFIQNATCTLPRGRPKPGQQVRATSGTDPEFANTAVTICKLVFTKGVRYPSFFWSKNTFNCHIWRDTVSVGVTKTSQTLSLTSPVFDQFDFYVSCFLKKGGNPFCFKRKKHISDICQASSTSSSEKG